MPRNNPHDHHRIGSKNAQRARSSKSAAGRTAIRALGEIATALATPAPKARLLDGLTSAERKQYPMAEGLHDYFPDALAEVSHVSWVGNEKHNPGERLHHARGKSNDHPDCIVRHLDQRGGFDTIVIKGVTYLVRHSAALAWRALALCQEEIELEKGLELPRGATAA